MREFRFAGDLTADSRAASAITWLLKEEENPCADADPNDPICGMQNP